MTFAETQAIKISMIPSQVIIPHGEQVTLHCVAHGPSNPMVTWEPHGLNFIAGMNGTNQYCVCVCVCVAFGCFW